MKRLKTISSPGILILSILCLFSAGNGVQTKGISEGIILSEPAPDKDGVIRILLYYDMEGLSGQTDWRTALFENPEYSLGRKYLTDDVNAVIDGLFKGGAGFIDVVDGHGSGNPEPDILLDRLDSRAKMVYRDEPFNVYTGLLVEGYYDAVVSVGTHSKTGSHGFCSHTWAPGLDFLLNDMSVSETETFAFAWGQVDVPVIFVSGDDKLKESLETMPWIEYVTVKYSKDAFTADLRPVAEVHQEMRAAAERSVKKISSAKVMKLTTPIKAGLRAAPPASLEILSGVPGIVYSDNAVYFIAADFLKAFDGIMALSNVAYSGYNSVLMDTVAGLENGDKVMKQFYLNLFDRWLKSESGQWTPPLPLQKKKMDRKYFGSE